MQFGEFKISLNDFSFKKEKEKKNSISFTMQVFLNNDIQ